MNEELKKVLSAFVEQLTPYLTEQEETTETTETVALFAAPRDIHHFPSSHFYII